MDGERTWKIESHFLREEGTVGFRLPSTGINSVCHHCPRKTVLESPTQTTSLTLPLPSSKPFSFSLFFVLAVLWMGSKSSHIPGNRSTSYYSLLFSLSPSLGSFICSLSTFKMRCHQNSPSWFLVLVLCYPGAVISKVVVTSAFLPTRTMLLKSPSIPLPPLSIGPDFHSHHGTPGAQGRSNSAHLEQSIIFSLQTGFSLVIWRRGSASVVRKESRMQSALVCEPRVRGHSKGGKLV